MARQRQDPNQFTLDFGTASIRETPVVTEAATAQAALPPADDASQGQPSESPPNQRCELPVPKPLESSVAKGVFGVDDNDDPVEPSPEEVREISRLHGERLAELFVLLDRVKEVLKNGDSTGRDSVIQEEERLTCQIQGMLALYAEDFGETAAKHLESWARAEAFDDVADDGSALTSVEEAPTPTDGPQYDPGHPWHYLARGDGQPPFPVEKIPPSECNGDFVGKLPKDSVKRRTKLRSISKTRRLTLPNSNSTTATLSKEVPKPLAITTARLPTAETTNSPWRPLWRFGSTTSQILVAASGG